MGTTPYWAIVVLVILMGVSMPQEGPSRKKYIILMACLHTFLSGFRYKYLTGDLIKYNTKFQNLRYWGYFHENSFADGINTGFNWFMKFISDISGGNYQLFLFLVAFIIEVTVAIIIYKYSPKPWLSYLVWNCVGFYIFGFSAVKQSLAMAFILIAVVYIMEDNWKKFLFFCIIAGTIHFPAFAFLPAYWIAKLRLNFFTMIFYIAVTAVIFIFRMPIINFVTSIYYEESAFNFNYEAGLGGRFYLIVFLLVCGILIKGFGNRKFDKVFNLLVVSAIFQMFSGYDNIFTRFTDYYFQISILYIPFLFCNENVNPEIETSNDRAIFPFNEQSLGLLMFFTMIVLVWYYDYTCLGATIAYATDNYLNYRFMWWNGG